MHAATTLRCVNVVQALASNSLSNDEEQLIGVEL